MKFFLKNQTGFTLVELMVVVAIIGILSAIAVPNFKRYQARSKTSEAKLQLSAAYTAEQSFFSDYTTYATCLRYMGYDPSAEASQRHYQVGFGTGTNIANTDTIWTTAEANGALMGASGCTGTITDGQTTFVAAKRFGNSAQFALESNTNLSSVITPTSSTTFTIGALGIISTSATAANTASNYTINQDKQLREVRPGY